MQQIGCVGPYTIQSPDFQDKIFVDVQKSRRVVVFTGCGMPVEPPSHDATLLHQSINCPEGTYDVRWYECPSEMGRTYTILNTGCNVLITSFDDGLLNLSGHSATDFGSSTFCFGKIYSGEDNPKIFDASTPCHTAFDFDGHLFTVDGNAIASTDLFECGECQQGEVSIFGGAEDASGQTQELPDSPAIPVEDVVTQTQLDIIAEEEEIEGENRTIWHNVPSDEDGVDVSCNTEKSISEADANPNTHATCGSHDNPSIASLPSGQAVIAYEERDEDGDTKINLALFKTTVGDNSIKYYRSLSRGRLLNSSAPPSGETDQSFDDFNRVDSGDLGADWVLSDGFLSSEILDERVRFSTSNIGLNISSYVYQIATSDTDMSVSYDARVSVLADEGWVLSFFARVSNPLNVFLGSFYLIELHDRYNSPDAIFVRIQRWIGGVPDDDTVDTVVLTESPFTEDLKNYRLEVSTEDSSVMFKLFAGDALIGTLQDTHENRLLVGTHAGFHIAIDNKTGNESFIDLDNFDVGEIAATGIADTFEVFDDFEVDLPAALGFLTGPAKGMLFNVTSIEREIQESGLPKHNIHFDPGGISIEFENSNDASDVSWFLIDTAAGLPGGTGLATILELPLHEFQGKRVPVAHPSIFMPNNNFMPQGEQYIYVAYQAFENNLWKIYVRQLRLVEKPESDPLYEAPYLFALPEFQSVSLGGSDFDQVIYKVVDVDIVNNNLCAIFEVNLPDGRALHNCDLEASGTTPATCNTEVLLDNSRAMIEALYSLVTCDPLSVPQWLIGAEFTGGYPPTASDIGFDGDVDCVVIEQHPVFDDWCFFKAVCSQTFVYDDPYCPNPFLSMTYAPEDLYNIDNNGTLITRVKYHASANFIVAPDQIDFMFVIDHSAGMGEIIQNVRAAVSVLAQTLRSSGINLRFGFVVYGRKDSGVLEPRVPSLSTTFSTSAISLSETATSIVFSSIDDADAPESAIDCGSGTKMFDGLIGFDSGGFTVSEEILADAMNHWYNGRVTSVMPGFSALKFGLTDSQFEWRSGADRYIMLITNKDHGELGSCGGFVNDKDTALATLLGKIETFKDFFDRPDSDSLGSDWFELSDASLNSHLETKSGGAAVDATDPYDVIYRALSMYKTQTSTPDMEVRYTAKVGRNVPPVDARIFAILRSDEFSMADSSEWNFYKIEIIQTSADTVGNIFRYNEGVESLIETKTFPGESLISGGDIDGPIFWKFSATVTSEDTVEISVSQQGVQIMSKVDTSTLSHRNGRFAGIGLWEFESNLDILRGIFLEDFVLVDSVRTTKEINALCITPANGGTCQVDDWAIDGSIYVPLSPLSGWTGPEHFPVYGVYENIFEQIGKEIASNLSKGRILQKDAGGYGASFIKPAELLITYNTDLVDLWTFDKSLLKFVDSAPSLLGDPVKGLNNLPFTLVSGQIYGVDPVHLLGDPVNWVYFDTPGPIVVDYPNFGAPKQEVAAPVLIASNATRPILFVNHRNDIFVAYESHEMGLTQIEIKGTGDFHQNSITGPKGTRITKFVDQGDFQFSHAVTVLGEGVNQLCDIVVDKSDITHMVWQSNRNGYWEIYYANSFDLFDPVRVTKSDSRSGMPKIDIDDEGSVFVVYHDNRFGPYEVMLSFKNERRVIPLLQQDAYLSSLRSDYVHYTNILPVFVQNGGNPIPIVAALWGSRTTSELNTKNSIFTIDESGEVDFDHNTGSQEFVAMAGSYDGQFCAVTKDGVLYDLDVEIFEYGIAVNSITSKGTIPTIISPDADPDEVEYISTITDMTFDNSERLWIQVVDAITDGENIMRLINVDKATAGLIAEVTIYESVDEAIGGITSLTDGFFFVVSYRDSVVKYSSSPYPFFTGSEVVFSFSDIFDLSVNGESLTNDSQSIYLLDDMKDIYVVDREGSLTPLVSIADNPYIGFSLQGVSGFAFQFTGESLLTGESDFFHVYVEFYDNKNLEGDPAVIVDSRKNLEAFINDEGFDDPYISVTKFNSGGIFLDIGEGTFIFFDASHFRPEFGSLSYPYSFDTNQTYFPKVFRIDSSGIITLVDVLQTVSFSCNKCNRLGDNNFNASACSYSISVTNDANVAKFFNLKFEFYTDQERTHLIRVFEAVGGSDDLQFFEVDNAPASDVWADEGLEIASGASVFLQVYPVLDPQAGFLCGVPYHVTVRQCNASENDAPCTVYARITPDNWITTRLDASSEPAEVTQISVVEPDLLSVYTDGRNEIMKMGRFDEQLQTWSVETVEVGSDISSPSLFEIGERAAIAYVKGESNPQLRYVRLTSKGWRDSLVDGSNAIAINHVSLIRDIDGQPAISYAVIGSTSSVVKFAKSNATTGIWDITTLASGAEIDEGQNSLALIDSSPAIVYHSQGELFYRSFNSVTQMWASAVSVESATIVSGPRLVDLNSQPAVAYGVGEIGQGDKIRFATMSGGIFAIETAFASVDTSARIENKLGLAVTHGIPVIAFGQIQSTSPREALYFIKKTDAWESEVVTEKIAAAIDITSLKEQAAISWREFDEELDQYYINVTLYNSRDIISFGTEPEFFCECSSNIFFGEGQQAPLALVSRWQSSNNGYSDTRITDSPGNSMRPSIKTRTSGAAMILFEDYNEEKSRILGATFRVSNQNQQKSSGTMSWFDFDFNIGSDANGARDVDLDADLYDRIVSIYEKPDQPDGASPTSTTLPSNSLSFKNCDFDAESAIDDDGETAIECDISKLESNIITSDPFISARIVKKLQIMKSFVDYFTYNASGTVSPVVSVCDIKLEIIGTPEVVAFRVKNENESDFGSWCPWSPEIGENMVQTSHRLSPSSGVKEVCVQAMTYAGVTGEFCLTVIADYDRIIFETRLFSDDLYSLPLPKHEGFAVAATKVEGESDPKTGLPVPIKKAEVFIEIIPAIDVDKTELSYDVLQQGINDLFDLEAVEAISSDGQKVFRGSFFVNREDKILNLDGLARIRVKIPGVCDAEDAAILFASGAYIRDQFNLMSHDPELTAGESAGDVLAESRQLISGRVGVPIVLRPTEDPYLIFGDPEFFFKKTDNITGPKGIQIIDDDGSGGGGDDGDGGGDDGGDDGDGGEGGEGGGEG